MQFQINPKETYYFVYRNTGSIKLPFGSFILEFFDIDFQYLLDNFPYDFHSLINGYYIDRNNKFSDYEAKAREMPMLSTIVEQENEIVGNYCSSINSGNINFKEHISEFFRTLDIYRNELSQYLLNKDVDDDSYISMLDYGQEINVKFHFINKEDGLWSEYDIKHSMSVVYFDLYNCISNGIKLNKCQNCHKFFIPKNRSDEIYCNRFYRENKTCKQIGYEEKVKTDPFMQAYTKARKTQHARIRYNSHITDYKEKHFEPWKKSAEKARDEFKSNNDIDGFLKWLDDNKNNF